MWKGLRHSKLMGRDGRASDATFNQNTYDQAHLQPRFMAAYNSVNSERRLQTPSGEAPSDEPSMLDRDLPALPFMQEKQSPTPERPVSSVYTRPSPDFGYDFDEDARPAPLFSGESTGQSTRATTADSTAQHPSDNSASDWVESSYQWKQTTATSSPENSTYQDRMKRLGQGLGVQPLQTRDLRDPWNGASGRASLMTPIPASNASVTDHSDVSPIDPQSRPTSKVARTISPVSSAGDLQDERQKSSRALDRKTSDSLLTKPTWNVSSRIEQFSKSNSSLSTVRGSSPAPDKISQPRIDQFSESGDDLYSNNGYQDADGRGPDKLAPPRIQKYSIISQTSGPIKKKAVPRMEKFSVTSSSPRSDHTIERKPPPVSQASKIPIPKPTSAVNNPKLRDPNPITTTNTITAPTATSSTTTATTMMKADSLFTSREEPVPTLTPSPLSIQRTREIEETTPIPPKPEPHVPASPATPSSPTQRDGKITGFRRRGVSASSMSPPVTPVPDKATTPPPPPVSRFSWTTRATSVDNTPEKPASKQSLDASSPYSAPMPEPIPNPPINAPRPATTENNDSERPQLVSRFSWTTVTGSEMMSEAASPPRFAESRPGPVEDSSPPRRVKKADSPQDSIMARAHPFAKMKIYDPATLNPERESSPGTATIFTPSFEKREIASSPIPAATTAAKQSRGPPSLLATPTASPSAAAVHVVKRKPTPSAVGAKRASGGSGKELPLSPQALASIDIITALQAQLDDFELKRINLNTLLEAHIKQETTPQGQNPITRDLARRRRDASRQAELEAELDDVKRQEYEVGLRLHMAWKRREQEAPSALWVRRVTG